MELRIIGRGALAGLGAGIIAFIYAWLLAEPLIDRAIDYEDERDHVLAAVITAATGQADGSHDHEIFSRTEQSTVGLATGVIGFSIAMGALAAVAYLVLHGRFRVAPRTLVLAIAGLGFTAIFLLPFLKYPANPPSIGNPDTIKTRGALYLAMLVGSLLIVGGAALLARWLNTRLGTFNAILAAVAAGLVVYAVLFAVLPVFGDLGANHDLAAQFGYVHASTETPQAITNFANVPITLTNDPELPASVAGKTFAPGQVVLPGFNPDQLWQFRLVAVGEQVLIWSLIGIGFGTLVQRYLSPRPAAKTAPVPVG